MTTVTPYPFFFAAASIALVPLTLASHSLTLASRSLHVSLTLASRSAGLEVRNDGKGSSPQSAPGRSDWLAVKVVAEMSKQSLVYIFY